MSEISECDVAIIGGGIAGASAAVAFAQHGLSVRLFERRDLARDPNRGDIMHPPTVAVVRRLGLMPLFEERGVTVLREVRTVDSGGAFEVETDSEDTLVLNHAEMENAYMDAAEALGAVSEHIAARSLTHDGDGWLVETERGTWRARFLVGADGFDSLTRRTLGIEHQDLHEYDNWIVVLHADRPSWLEPECGWQVIHPEGAIFVLPTTPDGRVRLVILIRKEDAKEWMTASEERIAELLAERHPDLGVMKVTKRGGSHVYRLKRSHANRYVGPRVGLSGDAIHTVHSMGGQGLNIAVQDSVKLAELIGPVLNDPAATEADFDAALAEYEAIRRPINQEAIDKSERAAETARPGQDAYEQALVWYRQAIGDRSFARKHGHKFGGRES